jgi:hypothetical protein
MELWIGCVAGALEESEYRHQLAKAGFEQITLEPTRIYQAKDAREFVTGCCGIESDNIVPLIDGTFMSAFVRAQKPATSDSKANSIRRSYCRFERDLMP